MRTMRRWIARSLGLVVFCLTLGQVTIDWTGSESHLEGADKPTIEAERTPGQAGQAD